jgi:hypothetical protein
VTCSAPGEFISTDGSRMKVLRVLGEDEDGRMPCAGGFVLFPCVSFPGLFANPSITERSAANTTGMKKFTPQPDQPFRVQTYLQAVQPQIPLECGLRLKPGFADNTISLKDD